MDASQQRLFLNPLLTKVMDFIYKTMSGEFIADFRILQESNYKKQPRNLLRVEESIKIK